MGFLCLILVLLFSTLCPSSVAITLMGKRELVALLCVSDVLWPLVFFRSSHVTMYWSAVSDCGILLFILTCFFEMISNTI